VRGRGRTEFGETCDVLQRPSPGQQVKPGEDKSKSKGWAQEKNKGRRGRHEFRRKAKGIISEKKRKTSDNKKEETKLPGKKRKDRRSDTQP